MGFKITHLKHNCLTIYTSTNEILNTVDLRHLNAVEAFSLFSKLLNLTNEKAFACLCVTLFYTLYGSGLLAQVGGGEMFCNPKTQGLSP